MLTPAIKNFTQDKGLQRWFAIEIQKSQLVHLPQMCAIYNFELSFLMASW